MLALAWLNTESYAKAAELLQDDPEREADPSLQFAYGMALVKSDRAAEGERVFAQLLRAHGDSAELSVLLGQAHAQQGDFTAAIETEASAASAQVAEASATLGNIYRNRAGCPRGRGRGRSSTNIRPTWASRPCTCST